MELGRERDKGRGKTGKGALIYDICKFFDSLVHLCDSKLIKTTEFPSMSIHRVKIEHEQLNKTIEQKIDSTKVNVTNHLLNKKQLNKN